MKKSAVLNAQLSHLIASVGHTDGITICDAGLPIPNDVARVDLALTQGVPTFLQTLEVVSHELFIERALIAEEIKLKNPQIHTALLAHFQTLEQVQQNKIFIEYVSHEEFKQFANHSKGIVRTGECSPYANVILYSGVPF
ncbi:D-ribose pyranase [Conservatibacter flavescens]|uniref:D-ribose pyranase n=1 Tax=Conservatibacter flavescens TaxID=28161 RepID=A0A2M8S1C2_9PAST|nr:D-ribose pyranase [Conservatibacter flavescens]PJG84904.1 D-ribose pyranase [Conservatibacter flavescens]